MKDNLEKALAVPVQRYFPGNGTAYTDEEDDENYTGDESWIKHCRHLVNVLSFVNWDPDFSVLKSISLANYIHFVSIDLNQKDFEYESTYMELYFYLAWMLDAINDRLNKNNPVYGFLDMTYTEFMHECEEIIKGGTEESAGGCDYGKLREEMIDFLINSDELSPNSPDIEEYIQKISKEITGTPDRPKTLREIAKFSYAIFSARWEPDKPLGEFIDRNRALWIALYDLILVPLMKAAKVVVDRSGSLPVKLIG